jgi:hypothetical protein
VTRIVIEPAPMELGLHRDAYEALVADFRERGYDAELRQPIEERGGVPQELVNAALWVGERISDGTAEVIIGIYLERMRRSRRRRRKPPPRPSVAVLYGPDGKPLRKVEIPEHAGD